MEPHSSTARESLRMDGKSNGNGGGEDVESSGAGLRRNHNNRIAKKVEFQSRIACGQNNPRLARWRQEQLADAKALAVLASSLGGPAYGSCSSCGNPHRRCSWLCDVGFQRSYRGNALCVAPM